MSDVVITSVCECSASCLVSWWPGQYADVFGSPRISCPLPWSPLAGGDWECRNACDKNKLISKLWWDSSAVVNKAGLCLTFLGHMSWILCSMYLSCCHCWGNDRAVGWRWWRGWEAILWCHFSLHGLILFSHMRNPSIQLMPSWS